jgi:adenosine 3'-phospho 5'-phosphosulfate transporter B3
MADYTLDPLQFNSLGLVLVSGSVVADSILPNAQEHLFKAGSSRLEVTVFSNLFSLIGMTVITLGDGTLLQFWDLIRRDSTLAMYFAVYTILSYASISCYMILVKRFGGVTAVVLTTARKAMTLVLSFMLFPKGFSWLYVYGSLLVLGAVMMASICKKMGPPSRDIKGVYAPLSRSDEGCVNDRLSMSNISLLDNSHLESCAAAILDGISKCAYV